MRELKGSILWKRDLLWKSKTECFIKVENSIVSSFENSFNTQSLTNPEKKIKKKFNSCQFKKVENCNKRSWHPKVWSSKHTFPISSIFDCTTTWKKRNLKAAVSLHLGHLPAVLKVCEKNVYKSIMESHWIMGSHWIRENHGIMGNHGIMENHGIMDNHGIMNGESRDNGKSWYNGRLRDNQVAGQWEIMR